ncbi:MAG: MAPEG family protein [Hyphomonadaceae bacterium]
MPQTAIFLPVAVLALWTIFVLLLVPIRRFAAGAAKKVTHDDFRLGESANVPAEVTIANRAWMNLLEAPMLFYVACIVLFVTTNADQPTIALAWGYVALRIVHTLIHVTYNKVLHRLIPFALSNVVLATIWIRLMSDLLSAPGV